MAEALGIEIGYVEFSETLYYRLVDIRLQHPSHGRGRFHERSKYYSIVEQQQQHHHHSYSIFVGAFDLVRLLLAT